MHWKQPLCCLKVLFLSRISRQWLPHSKRHTWTNIDSWTWSQASAVPIHRDLGTKLTKDWTAFTHRLQEQPKQLCTNMIQKGKTQTILAQPGCCLPFPEGKKQSISTLLREWEMQRALLGTRPSWGGLRSVVRTKHQPGLSLGLSSSSTVCPTWMLSSLLWPAVKSWSTTVSSHPPDNCPGSTGRRKKKKKKKC